MSRKDNGDPAAAAMAEKRWKKTAPQDRIEHARKMAEARWGKKKPGARKKKAGGK